MKPTQNRNLAIDWIKGWMILCVVLLHTWSLPHFHGHLAVDVFYFICGYFMMQSRLHHPTTTVSYTWKRIKGIAIPFIISLVVACCMHYNQFFSLSSLDAVVDKYAEVFYTFSFAEETGLNTSITRLLLGSWFFSVLIIGSFILYGILEFNERLATRILFPLISLFGFSAMICHADSFSTWTHIASLRFPLVRGLAEMAAGALICSVYVEHKLAFERHATFINIMGILASILFVSMLFTQASFDKFIVITVPWMLLASAFDGSWLSLGLRKIQGGLISRIGRYTLYILCAHGPAIMLVNRCNEALLHGSLRGFWLICLDLVSTAIATYALYWASKKIRLLFESK